MQRLKFGGYRVAPDTVVRALGPDLYQVEVGEARCSIQVEALSDPVRLAVYPASIRKIVIGEPLLLSSPPAPEVAALVLERFRAYLRENDLAFEER